MTTPSDIVFIDESLPTGEDFTLEDNPAPDGPEPTGNEFPPPIIDISDEAKEGFLIWMDQWIQDMESQQQDRLNSWSDYEVAYRARRQAPKTKPFVGACNEVVPVIAMAVDPIHARLDTGIFKQEPVIQIKGLKKSVLDFVPSLVGFIDYYQKHKLKLREVASPRLMELTKLGTCIFKTVFDQESYSIKTYDRTDNWKVVDRVLTTFSGPRVFGVGLSNFLCPAHYQRVQDCPIVAEKMRLSFGDLKKAEAAKKLTNVDAIKGQEDADYNVLDVERQEAADHKDLRRDLDSLIVYEVWCKYDINGDGIPENLVATYHKETRTLLQLRYNWYFHQRYPYTVIPYSISNDSIFGVGISEMVIPFQDAMTRWHQMASDNAYLANIRMFIGKKDSGIEDAPSLYTGRVFKVDDPSKDFVPFQAGDTYPSTLQERQNLFGLVEKRTGVSDYLTGRESPIIGSRATATSTIALIQEGTRRVEQVLENIRIGMSEVIENCVYIWIQYGLRGVDDLAFKNDKIAEDVQAFFKTVDEDNILGALGIELSATDATTNKQAMQQMQLQIINVMMQFYEKTLLAAEQALLAQQQMPELVPMIAEVMAASRKLFTELLHKYEIRNPEDFVPDLEAYLNGSKQPNDSSVRRVEDQLNGAGGFGGIQTPLRPPAGPPVPVPAAPGGGGGLPSGLPPTG